MCLTTKDPIIKLAKKPIFCFKAGRFEDDNPDIIKGFSLGVDYVRGNVSPHVEIHIEEEDPRDADLILRENYTVEEGYHSFNKFRHIRKEMKYLDVGIFAIPKGANYFDGYFNNNPKYLNRVSSQIVYVCPATFWNRVKLLLGLLKCN